MAVSIARALLFEIAPFPRVGTPPPPHKHKQTILRATFSSGAEIPMLATAEQHRGENMRTITAVALLGALVAVSRTPGAPTKAEKAAAKKPVYDEKADAKAAIEAALAAARRENRRVLIQWGGNWCSWCLLLHDRFEKDADLAKKLRYEYDVVAVDVGKIDKNLDLAAKYGADFRKHGVPYLTVLDADGKPLANQPTDPFETKQDGKNGHDPKKLLEFLSTHQARPLDADKVLSAALAEAAKTERAVFLHFGAPWCGWCLKLDAWLLRPEVASILHKDFVDVKIDQDRMTGGKEVLARYRPDDNGGIPWFVFLDSKGKEIITSDSPKGNIGFPAAADEIDHFVAMLKKARRRITDQEIDALRKTLTPPVKAPAGQ
jgi:thiol:disulfide interchange protein